MTITPEMAASCGASRMETFFQSLHTLYAGNPDTNWWFGAAHISRHDNWNRVVMWPAQGPITPPETAAQGYQTDEGGTDDVVFHRQPQIFIGMWCASFEQAEHRLHSMLVALDDLLAQADITLTNINEAWPMNQNQDLSTGGVEVVLSMSVSFNVLAQDTAITAYDAATSPSGDRPGVGDGQDTDTVTSVNLNTPDESDVTPVTVTQS